MGTNPGQNKQETRDLGEIPPHHVWETPNHPSHDRRPHPIPTKAQGMPDHIEVAITNMTRDFIGTMTPLLEFPRIPTQTYRRRRPKHSKHQGT